jgi:hypothetical protein
MQIRKHVGAFAGALGFVSVLVTILAFAVPTARDWMLRHAALIWILAGILLTATLGLSVLLDGSNQRATAEAQAHQTELDAAHGATKQAAAEWDAARQGLTRTHEAELENAHATRQVEADRDAARQDVAVERLGAERIADGELLTERLGPWRQGCGIMDWLKNTMDGDKIPVPFLDQIGRRRLLWGNDTRTLASAKVETAFDRLRAAINVYGSGMSSTMWLSSDQTFMAVPIEWGMTRPTDFEDALETNGEAGLEMLGAMQNVFAVIHEHRVRLGPIPPADAEDLKLGSEQQRYRIRR